MCQLGPRASMETTPSTEPAEARAGSSSSMRLGSSSSMRLGNSSNSSSSCCCCCCCCCCCFCPMPREFRALFSRGTQPWKAAIPGNPKDWWT